MAQNNLTFKRTEEDSVLCLRASTQTLCSGNFKPRAAPSSDLPCSQNGSYMHETPHRIFLKLWLHSTTEPAQYPGSADRRGRLCHHLSQSSHPAALQGYSWTLNCSTERSRQKLSTAKGEFLSNRQRDCISSGFSSCIFVSSCASVKRAMICGTSCIVKCYQNPEAC